ncbi:MAG: helix-turn-helix transcriptional regulator [Clostridiales bacterium]|nr:helix-turn-helix transcriptional regulator [Clostridiales bacterium]
MKAFNEKLRELRAERGLTQKQVATALSITIPTLSHWECGYQEPSYKDLLAICRFYEVTADYLIDPKEH